MRLKLLLALCALTGASPLKGADLSSPEAAFVAYRSLYERDDRTAIVVYSDLGGIRIGSRHGAIPQMPLIEYKTILNAMLSGAKERHETSNFTDIEHAVFGDVYVWRGKRTVSTTKERYDFIVDIKKEDSGLFQIFKETLLLESE